MGTAQKPAYLEVCLRLASPKRKGEGEAKPGEGLELSSLNGPILLCFTICSGMEEPSLSCAGFGIFAHPATGIGGFKRKSPVSKACQDQ